MKTELSVGILYLGLHNQLVKKYGVGNVINRKEFFFKISRDSKIPRHLRGLVMKEMVEKKLLRKVNRDCLEILKVDIDLEGDCKPLFKIAGIY